MINYSMQNYSYFLRITDVYVKRWGFAVILGVFYINYL